MSSPAKLCLFLISLLLSPTVLTAADDDSKTVYEILEDYDFPSGLLPKGIVTGYELDESSGKFKVYMNQSCSFTIDSYPLKYKSTISGVITKDRLKNLKGISVKVLLLWVNIVEVTHDGDELDFSVGILSADFPADNFEESPQCGCGFDCDKLIMELGQVGVQMGG